MLAPFPPTLDRSTLDPLLSSTVCLDDFLDPEPPVRFFLSDSLISSVTVVFDFLLDPRPPTFVLFLSPSDVSSVTTVFLDFLDPPLLPLPPVETVLEPLLSLRSSIVDFFDLREPEVLRPPLVELSVLSLVFLFLEPPPPTRVLPSEDSISSVTVFLRFIPPLPPVDLPAEEPDSVLEIGRAHV